MRRRLGAIALLSAVLAALAAIAVLRLTSRAEAATCTKTVHSAQEAQTAVSKAKTGDVVCLADGVYGPISLDARKRSPGVTLRARTPGRAVVARVKLAGRHLTIARLRLTGEVTVATGSVGMRIDRNLLIGRGRGGGYGVLVCPADPPDHCDDVSITRNRFVGRFDEDAIRANVYHDGPDADRDGLLIEDNEFTGNVEYGGHNDVFQSVWVGDHLVFRGNYLHDFGGQGFFVKDQASAIDGLVVEDNLIIRQDRRCEPASLCPGFQLSPFQIFGPIRNGVIRHNTVWPGRGGGFAVLRGTGWSSTTVSDNVFGAFGRDPTVDVAGANNTRCSSNGRWPSVPGTTRACAPRFEDPGQGDYRLRGGRGVRWRVSAKHFGP
ncbi:MAG TPA: right-handed parallel beta-helix repeat-containing protein [Solirubrobacteraceae bacterium]